ncbi:MAG: dihydroorotate dehydrogenase-like protein [Bacteroidales bacterium]
MVDLQVSYAGLQLRNPFIISSSGLTNTVDKCVALEQAGAGAIVLKSLFEEQMNILSTEYLRNNTYPEAEDYIRQYVQAERMDAYTTFVQDVANACTIPVIASINCFEKGLWVEFAEAIENAGAKALELNISLLDTSKNPINVVAEHVEIVRAVVKRISIPVIVKIGENHSNLVHLVESLKGAGAKAVVLFNRFYPVDININTLEMGVGSIFSHKGDVSKVIRWVGIVSGKTDHIDIAASTGVLDWEDAVKVILSGATGVQICSAIYQEGNEVVNQMAVCLEEWMQKHGFKSISDFRGKLNSKDISDANYYERTQFLKYLTNRDSK